MTTGYSTVENAMQSLACGALDFTPKPFTADEVLAVIHRGLACSHLRAQRPPGGLPPVPPVQGGPAPKS